MGIENDLNARAEPVERDQPTVFTVNTTGRPERRLDKADSLWSAIRVRPRIDGIMRSVRLAQPRQDFLRLRLDGSAGFQPAVSPISNRQDFRQPGPARKCGASQAGIPAIQQGGGATSHRSKIRARCLTSAGALYPEWN